MFRFSLHTAEKSVHGFDFVHQAGLGQEVQRPVDRRRFGFGVLLSVAIQQIVGADGFMTGADQFQNASPGRRQADITLFADGFGRSQGLFNAVAVIVLLQYRRIGGHDVVL